MKQLEFRPPLSLGEGATEEDCALALLMCVQEARASIADLEIVSALVAGMEVLVCFLPQINCGLRVILSFTSKA